ncbi:MAG TPA: hypothetical protein VIG33_10170 [Pseudobdellovibrionaceae bacterium]
MFVAFSKINPQMLITQENNIVSQEFAQNSGSHQQDRENVNSVTIEDEEDDVEGDDFIVISTLPSLKDTPRSRQYDFRNYNTLDQPKAVNLPPPKLLS